MRKLLINFLILLMLTPSLACAMPVCADTTQAAAMEQPCTGHPSRHGEKQQDTGIGKVTLLKDCMGVDLQLADNAPTLKKYDLQKDFHFIAATKTAILHDWMLTDARDIRGPPPDWPDFHQTQPPILLTAQHFLI